jgi:hypothetical protein
MWSTRWSLDVRASMRQRHLEVAQQDDRPRGLELVAPVRAVARLRIDPRRPQDVELVVVPERADRQAREPRESTDHEQVLEVVGSHGPHRGPSTYPRVKS